jgi:hypothetical protein
VPQYSNIFVDQILANNKNHKLRKRKTRKIKTPKGERATDP